MIFSVFSCDLGAVLSLAVIRSANSTDLNSWVLNLERNNAVTGDNRAPHLPNYSLTLLSASSSAGRESLFCLSVPTSMDVARKRVDFAFSGSFEGQNKRDRW
jgi:hypothetical protein